MNDVVFEAFSAEMHVGEETHQRGIVGKCSLNLRAKIIRARWDDERVIVELQCDRPLSWSGLGEDNTDARLVYIDVAVSCVVHLKDEIRAGGDEFRHAL